MRLTFDAVGEIAWERVLGARVSKPAWFGHGSSGSARLPLGHGGPGDPRPYCGSREAGRQHFHQCEAHLWRRGQYADSGEWRIIGSDKARRCVEACTADRGRRSRTGGGG